MLRSRFLLSSLLCVAVGVAAAQQPRVSPPDIAGSVIDGNRVTIYYSRPHTKDPQSGAARKIWGELVPYGKIWRMGANEATLLVIQKPIEIAGQTIPGGAYTLFLQPEEGGKATLVVNKQIGQWGLQYDDKQDQCRVQMSKEDTSAPVEQFTMAVAKNAGGGGVIKLMWENTQFSVPFTTVK